MKEKKSSNSPVQRKSTRGQKVAAYYETTYKRKKISRVLRRNGIKAAEDWASKHNGAHELVAAMRKLKSKLATIEEAQ